MQIAILLYPEMTALDAIGPYELLSRLPEANVAFVAREPGWVRTDTGFLRLAADTGIQDLRAAEILLIPGGPGDAAVRSDDETLDWVREIHAGTRFTTSVCTGSLILGAAGILKGLPATSHWTQREALREFGATPSEERVVEAGKVITAAGVSAGIDMALRLVQIIAGDDFAQALQLGIEYDPQPPFDSGAPDKAPTHIVELVRTTMAR